MVPLDVCHKTRLSRDELISIGEHKHPFCQFVKESVEPWINIRSDLVSDEGLHLYDSLAMAICFAPELVESEPAYVAVETAGDHSTGETVCKNCYSGDSESDNDDVPKVISQKFINNLFNYRLKVKE